MYSGRPYEALLGGVHTGATWRIPLNCPCVAGMRPFCQISYFNHLLININLCWTFLLGLFLQSYATLGWSQKVHIDNLLGLPEQDFCRSDVLPDTQQRALMQQKYTNITELSGNSMYIILNSSATTMQQTTKFY